MSETDRKLFLGIDGGQSSTKAVGADESGNVLGIGFGGALNHGNCQEKLLKAVAQSVSWRSYSGSQKRQHRTKRRNFVEFKD